MEGFVQRVVNTTHGSGWILSDPFYEMSSGCGSETPPTAVGGWFRSFLQKSVPQKHDASRLEHTRPYRDGSTPQRILQAQCQHFAGRSYVERIGTIHRLPSMGFQKTASADFGRKDLNKPPTAVGGIYQFLWKAELKRGRPRRAAPTKMVVRISLVLMCCLFGCAQIVAQPLPTYEAARVTSKLRIDGQLNEKAWREATAISPFLNNHDGSSSKIKTEARILYDERFIYFAFRAADQNIWATMRRRDQHLWLEEVVEVFLQASTSTPNYIELEVNPLGTMLDIYLLDKRKPLHYESWNSEKLLWAVRVDGTVDGKGGDREWTCEIALPFEDVVTAPRVPPQAGDRWLMNLFRVERKPEVAELAWSPTLEDDFHVLPKFGELIFTNRRVPSR